MRHKQYDEDILYEAYLVLGHNAGKKNKKISESTDQRCMKGISSKLALVLSRFIDSNNLSEEDLIKNLIRAKGLYFQFCLIEHRHPGFVNSYHKEMMEKILRAICTQEAHLIGLIRQQRVRGEKIDLRTFFDSKAIRNRLQTTLASKILNEELYERSARRDYWSKVFITDTGKRYHRIDCPYCKGKELTAVTMTMAENLRLTPCKCMLSGSCYIEPDHTCITAFVDESIHKVIFNEKGKKGKAGSFSYIICWGDLQHESEIVDKDIIACGVDYTGEHEHIERITETAIGKVLLTLAYDLEYTGKVRIYSDNQSAVGHWRDRAINSKLAFLFEYIDVCYIPRESNKRADHLGRTRMLLDMPITSYNEMISKIQHAEKMEKENQLLLLMNQLRVDLYPQHENYKVISSYAKMLNKRKRWTDHIRDFLRSWFSQIHFNGDADAV